MRTPWLACFVGCLVNSAAFVGSQEAQIASARCWGGRRWGRYGPCLAALERQAEARLFLGWLPGLEWEKGLPMKHESASEAWGGVGELWPNLVHNWGGKHPPCALRMLSFKKFMNLLTHPVLFCGSSLFRRMNTELKWSWESLPNTGFLHFYRIFFTLAALINCLKDPPQEQR